ncbi:MAG: tetraacyldisaccharide 4'-kinase, partial [Planctomycetes bacterium]|nr:tetraacyldisaccharide 4'-kinase [Planctomycetota bacterium]
LALLSLLYGLVTGLRNYYYDVFNVSFRSPLFVISVGNLSAGGTGKTPLCLFLAQELIKLGHKPALCLRGYAQKSGLSDEAELYHQALGESAVFMGAKRSESLQRAHEQGYEIALLDDAFQHRLVQRDIDIIVVDATRLPSKDYWLPLGFLRESMRALKRAHILVINRCEMISEKELASFISALGKKHAQLTVIKVRTGIKGVVDLDGQPISLSQQKVFLATAIGNPRNFLHSAQGAALEVCGSHFFPDHHHFSEDDVRKIEEKARETQSEAILMTSKDAVKWPRKGEVPVWVLEVSPIFEGKAQYADKAQDCREVQGDSMAQDEVKAQDCNEPNPLIEAIMKLQPHS